MAHENNGACQKCLKIVSFYPNFHPILLNWFLDLQIEEPMAHISCAGRGREAQEQAFLDGKTHAHYGQSAHNYNLALDLFQLTNEGSAKFSVLWYISLLEDRLRPALLWYGNEGPYRDYPHIEIRNWENLIPSPYGLVEI